MVDEHNVSVLLANLGVENPLPVGRHGESIVVLLVGAEDFSNLPSRAGQNSIPG